MPLDPAQETSFFPSSQIYIDGYLPDRWGFVSPKQARTKVGVKVSQARGAGSMDKDPSYGSLRIWVQIPWTDVKAWCTASVHNLIGR